jgi:hypothetical protein
MNEQWRAPRSEVEILAILARQLGAASQRARRRPAWRTRWARSSLAIALAALLVAGGAAVAATRILSVGDTIPAGGPGGPPENRTNVPQTIVAKGITPVAGPFQITTYGSAGVSDEGEVLEPRGLPCLELNLTDPPPTPTIGSAFCGRGLRERFTVSTLEVLGVGGRKELIVWGSLPADARAARVVADGDEQIPVQRFDGPTDYPGDVWAAALSAGHSSVRAEWVRANGSQGDRAEDLSDYLRNLRSTHLLR